LECGGTHAILPPAAPVACCEPYLNPMLLCARQVRSVPGELSMDTNAVLRLAQATGHVAKPQLTQARARRQRQEAAKRMGVTRLDATRLCCLSVRTMLGAQTYAPCVCVTRRALHGLLTFGAIDVVGSLCCACRGTGTIVCRSHSVQITQHGHMADLVITGKAGCVMSWCTRKQ